MILVDITSETRGGAYLPRPGFTSEYTFTNWAKSMSAPKVRSTASKGNYI